MWRLTRAIIIAAAASFTVPEHLSAHDHLPPVIEPQQRLTAAIRWYAYRWGEERLPAYSSGKAVQVKVLQAGEQVVTLVADLQTSFSFEVEGNVLRFRGPSAWTVGDTNAIAAQRLRTLMRRGHPPEGLTKKADRFQVSDASSPHAQTSAQFAVSETDFTLRLARPQAPDSVRKKSAPQNLNTLSATVKQTTRSLYPIEETKKAVVVIPYSGPDDPEVYVLFECKGCIPAICAFRQNSSGTWERGQIYFTEGGPDDWSRMVNRILQNAVLILRNK